MQFFGKMGPTNDEDPFNNFLEILDMGLVSSNKSPVSQCWKSLQGPEASHLNNRVDKARPAKSSVHEVRDGDTEGNCWIQRAT